MDDFRSPSEAKDGVGKGIVMHEQSYKTMEREFKKLGLSSGSRVVDVGSRDVNGTYRQIVEDAGCSYFGIDIRDGPNVDMVVTEDTISTAGIFHTAISGSTLEHVKDMQVWMRQVVELIEPGGWLLVYTHHAWPEHRHPIDCWRILPDGLRWLFEQTGVLVDLEVEFVDDHDLFGKARKHA